MGVIARDWTTRAGFRAIVRRCDHISMMPPWLCGYVEIPKGHPLYEVGYSSECEALAPMVEAVENGPIGKRGPISVFCMAGRGVRPTPEVIFDVHGSLTFSGRFKDTGDAYFLGFDCNHCDDTPETCPLEYVEDECERLAEQIASVPASHSDQKGR